jgi:phytoene dehydrogenase-like protein
MLNAHVEEVMVEGGRARGVKLRGGDVVRASKSVVSNASMWDTQRLLPKHVITPKMRQEAQVSSL